MALTARYKKYIKSDAWKRKRQEAFAYHGKRCKACGKANKVLHVHHLDYTRFGNESVIHDLCILCPACHTSVTKIYRSNRRRGLRRVTNEYILFKQRKQ